MVGLVSDDTIREIILGVETAEERVSRLTGAVRPLRVCTTTQ